MSSSDKNVTDLAATAAPTANELNEQTKIRRQKLAELREKGLAYPHNVHVSHAVDDVALEYKDEMDSDVLRAKGRFELAGRVHFLRSFGKAAFVKVKGLKDSFQFYIAKKNITEEEFEVFKSLDLGDVIWVSGELFRTKTGELSLDAKAFKLLTKSLHTPPEKFHGLTNIEDRYRKRYLDLMTNDDSKSVFLKRAQIVQEIRNFFLTKNFLEVETPMMSDKVTGAEARPFKTHHNTLDMELNLRIAPELNLKRLVVGGLDRVFEMNRNFRNEGMSVRHNPEFTMLEFYMAYGTYHDLMNLTEELVSGLSEKVCGSSTVTYQGEEVSFKAPWARMTMEESVQKHSEYKGSLSNVEEMKSYLSKFSIALTGREGPGALVSKIFEEDVESKLRQPTFITSYPVEISPLARRSDEISPNGLDVTDRFELFVLGQEIANGFNELNDPDDQKERFMSQLKEKEAGNVEATDYDEDYIHALEYGLPPTAGEGIGIDRLVMLLTDSASIRDVILFPQMRKES